MENKVLAAVIGALLIAVVGFSPMLAQTVHAVAGQPTSVYKALGDQSGTVNSTVTKTIQLGGASQLSFIISTSGAVSKFNNTVATVSVSVDGNTFVAVDTISLGNTSASIGKYYSDSNGSSTVVTNPTNFPYVKIATSAGVQLATEKITWSAR